MFALIKTNGATDIAIHIPKEGADKSLPAIAAMLESNAVFIRKGWRELEIVKPTMSIVLGDVVEMDGEETTININSGDDKVVLDESFVTATPQVMASNKAAFDKKEAEINRLRTELQHTKQLLQEANEKIDAMQSESEEC